MPVITDDGNGFGNHMWNWFNLGGYVPSSVFIDHTMTVFYKMNSLNTGLGNTKIQQMLTACEDAGLCGCSGPDSDNDGTPDQCDDCFQTASDNFSDDDVNPQVDNDGDDNDSDGACAVSYTHQTLPTPPYV